MPYLGGVEGSFAVFRPGTKVADKLTAAEFVSRVERLDDTAAAELLRLAEEAKNSEAAADEDGNGYAALRLREYASELQNLPLGRRNETLNTRAYHMGRMIGAKWIDRGTVEQTLRTAISHWDDQSKTLDTVLRALDDGEQNPHDDLHSSKSRIKSEYANLGWRWRAKGIPAQSIYNVRLALDNVGIECSYDTFHNKLLFGFRDEDIRHEIQFLIDDNIDHGIICLRDMMSDRYGFEFNETAVRDGVTASARKQCFDPVADFLDAAQAGWDRNPRLDRMAVDYFSGADTPLNRAMVRKTMIAAVRRVRQPGCKFDNILTLVSIEGLMKSTAWRVLAGDENFSDEKIMGLGSREVQEQLSEIWIHENAELAGMKKAEIESVKAFASRQEDRARPAYGHFLKKQASLSGQGDRW